MKYVRRPIDTAFSEEGDRMAHNTIDYSVIIPAYNCKGTIAAAIASVRSSGLRNYEIVVVDDGSSDDTGATLDRLAEENDDIVPIHQENGGVSAARNRGLQIARGKYLLFLDADDLISENAYQEIVKIIEQEQPDMLLFGMWFEHFYLGACYQKECVVSSSGGLLSADAWKQELVNLFRCNYLSPIWNKVIRRSVIVDNGIRFSNDMFVMEDCKFSLDCLQFCQTIYLLPEAIYHYQITDDGRKAAERVSRINSLSAYMNHFLCLPDVFSEVVREVYWMLLYQRIRAAKSVAQLQEQAEDCKNGPFRLDQIPRSEVFQALLAGRYNEILRFNRRRRIRHRAIIFGKVLLRGFLRKAETDKSAKDEL